MPSLKQLSEKEEGLSSGHRLCAGCAEPTIVRQVLLASDKPVVIANATGCLEVASTIYPQSAWKVPWIHSAFENTGATISGVEAMYSVKRRKGEINDDINLLAFGGDGSTYDIGFQALSGALERGHKFLYVCLNNEAYMNTGIQRSGATQRGASTTTSPAGSKVPGKTEFPKDLTASIIAHGIPYVAQASPAAWLDLNKKATKGFNANGPAFLNVISPCPRGWRHPTDVSIEMARLATETCMWPLYEVENGVYALTGDSKRIAEGKMEKKSAADFMKTQGRFKHLFSDANKHILDEIQNDVDKRWEALLKKAGMN